MTPYCGHDKLGTLAGTARDPPFWGGKSVQSDGANIRVPSCNCSTFLCFRLMRSVGWLVVLIGFVGRLVDMFLCVRDRGRVCNGAFQVNPMTSN